MALLLLTLLETDNVYAELACARPLVIETTNEDTKITKSK